MNSLGFDKPPQDTRVVAAMSGGVDSSVTAALLKGEGYEVIGITLQLYDDGAARRRIGACCAGQDIYDARRVADTLDIRHYVLDFENRFRDSVIDDFVDSYLAGETPIPCVRCNQTVKFRDLLGRARDLGADALATGHYVRRVTGPGGPELHRGADPARDQSYFLFATTPGQLDYLRFPLGAMPKDETRALAGCLGLAVADKPGSQDICFVPGGSYSRVIERLRPEAAEPGDIVDMDGKRLGGHGGVANFTVGQRRGLGLGGGDALYVIAIDAGTRRVIAGPRAALAVSGLTVRDLNWLEGAAPADGEAVRVRYRSAHEPVAATIGPAGAGCAAVRFAQPQFGVAPGQACVAYRGNRVLGGGWIASTVRAGASAGQGEPTPGRSEPAGALA